MTLSLFVSPELLVSSEGGQLCSHSRTSFDALPCMSMSGSLKFLHSQRGHTGYAPTLTDSIALVMSCQVSS